MSNLIPIPTRLMEQHLASQGKRIVHKPTALQHAKR
jgi:hypothetical protein